MDHWHACEGGFETGTGDAGARRFWLQQVEGGWLLHDRRMGSDPGQTIIATYGDVVRASAQSDAKRMVDERERALP